MGLFLFFEDQFIFDLDAPDETLRVGAFSLTILIRDV